MNRPFNSIPYRSNQSGMTLVEILVALVISLVLIGGVIQIFVGNKLTYRVQDNLSRIQENGRYAIELLNQDIRMANYRGCAGSKASTARNFLNNSSSINWDLLSANPVQGFHNPSSGWPAALTTTGLTSSDVIAGTDVITVRGPDTTNSGFVVSQASNVAALQVSQPAALNLQPNDIVMVADCSDIVVFQITNSGTITGDPASIEHAATGSSPGNSSNDLHKIFTGAEVTRLSAKTYYIGTGASGQPALYRRTPINGSQELIEGVENMQVVFGVDDAGICGTGSSNDGAIDCYRRADQITAAAWPNVRSIQIRLLLRSLENNLTPVSQPIDYNGATVNSGTGADRRLRQVFTSTIGLRNQLR
jgi:type IV pilus assembly protein PilW